METYKSKFTAEDLENTIGLVHGLVVPHVGDNGNWFVGETDTGVFAKGIDVTGAEVGQIVKVSEVDENGRPTAWDATELPKGKGPFRLLRTVTVPEDPSTDTSGVTWLERESGGYWFGFDTDTDGNKFKVSELFIIIKTALVSPNNSYPSYRLNGGTTPFYGGTNRINFEGQNGVNNWSWFFALGAFSQNIWAVNGGTGSTNVRTQRQVYDGLACESVSSISTYHDGTANYGLTGGAIKFYGR